MELSHEWAESVRLLLAICIPIIVGLITKSSASSGLKSTLGVVISAFVAGATTILDDADADVAGVIRAFILTSVTAGATYYNVWKPTGIAGTVTAKTAGFGLGSPPAPQLETQEKGLEDLVVEPEVMEAVADAAADPAKPKAKVAKKAAARKRTGG